MTYDSLLSILHCLKVYLNEIVNSEFYASTMRENEVINVNIKHHFNNGHIHTMPKDLKAKLKDIVK